MEIQIFFQFWLFPYSLIDSDRPTEVYQNIKKQVESVRRTENVQQLSRDDAEKLFSEIKCDQTWAKNSKDLEML